MTLILSALCLGVARRAVTVSAALTAAARRTQAAQALPVVLGAVSAGGTLQYRNGAQAPTDNVIRPPFKITKTGAADLVLKDVTVRYKYTNERTRAQQFWVDDATVGNANVQGTFVRPLMLGRGANSYLEVGVLPAAGTLHAGQGTGEVQPRFNPVDWSNYDERDDCSYDAPKTAYAPWTRMTVYVAGKLVWGTEPPPAYRSGGPFTLGQSFRVVAAGVRAVGHRDAVPERGAGGGQRAVIALRQALAHARSERRALTSAAFGSKPKA